MKLLLSICLLSLSTLAEPAPSPAANRKYPIVKAVKGKVTNLKSGDGELVKPRDLLTEKALLRVGEKASVRIELDAHSRLEIFENSRVDFPVITWSDGEVEQIILHKGLIRYECDKKCNRRITTELSDEVIKNGEYLFTYRPDSPNVEMVVFEGEQTFRGLENETSVVVHDGEKVVFQGLTENNETAFDYLLKGKKVARGKLQPVQKLTAAQTKKLKNTYSHAKQVAAAKPPPTPTPAANQICSSPGGALNQCLWTCEGKLKGQKNCDVKNPKIKCVRKRCNANGEWSDAQSVGPTDNQCELTPRVTSC